MNCKYKNVNLSHIKQLHQPITVPSNKCKNKFLVRGTKGSIKLLSANWLMYKLSICINRLANASTQLYFFIKIRILAHQKHIEWKKINQRKNMRVQNFIYVALYLYIQRCTFNLNYEIEEIVFITIFFEDINLLQIQHTSGIVR